MASDSRGLNRLKKLARDIPDEKTTYTILRELEKRENDHSADRATAILGCAIIENALRVAIVARLPPDKESHASIFEEPGPLWSSSARIALGFAFHIFGEATLSDLQCIRAIRNALPTRY